MGKWNLDIFSFGAQYPTAVPGKAARYWILEGQNGMARRTYYRLVACDRFSSRAIRNEVQFCLKPKLSHGGLSANQMALAPNPVDLTVRQDVDSDSGLAQDTSISGQFAKQRGRLRWRRNRPRRKLRKTN